jgi:hypothetical protein
VVAVDVDEVHGAIAEARRGRLRRLADELGVVAEAERVDPGDDLAMERVPVLRTGPVDDRRADLVRVGLHGSLGVVRVDADGSAASEVAEDRRLRKERPAPVHAHLDGQVRSRDLDQIGHHQRLDRTRASAVVRGHAAADVDDVGAHVRRHVQAAAEAQGRSGR